MPKNPRGHDHILTDDKKTERDSLKVQTKFLNWLKYDIIDEKFPIKAMNQLAVIATRLWIKKFLRATKAEKVEMIKEVIKERNEAENDGHLHNSRDIDSGDLNE